MYRRKDNKQVLGNKKIENSEKSDNKKRSRARRAGSTDLSNESCWQKPKEGSNGIEPERSERNLERLLEKQRGEDS